MSGRSNSRGGIRRRRNPPPAFLPSVDRGPVDVRLALSELDWTPTPLTTAVAETVRWFHAVAAARTKKRSGRGGGGGGGGEGEEEEEEEYDPGGGGRRHPHEEECREVARELRRGFGLRPGSRTAVALQKRLTALGFPSPRR